MAGNKTKPTGLGPDAYIAAIQDEGRRKDCETLSSLMARVSKRDAQMWGPSIVGFGTHKYALAGGKVGEICAVGFSSRKGDITIYGVAGEGTDPALLKKLGKHKLGKGCLYVRQLADVDLEALEQLIGNAVRAKLA
jgi:hypothetical protein